VKEKKERRTKRMEGKRMRIGRREKESKRGLHN